LLIVYREYANTKTRKAGVHEGCHGRRISNLFKKWGVDIRGYRDARGCLRLVEIGNQFWMCYILTMAKPIVITFGSQTTGLATASSDFDFGVFADKPLTLTERTHLAGRLAKKFRLNEDKIDLVDLTTASPILKFEVAKVGKLVIGEQFDFIRYKVRAFKEYQDTAKFRRLREKIMLNQK